MFWIMVPSTSRAFATVSCCSSDAKPRLTSSGRILSARMYSSLATSSMSAGSMRIVVQSDEIERVDERAKRCSPSRRGDDRPVRFAPPASEFDDQQPQPARKVRCEQENERDLRSLHKRALGPGEERVERVFTRQRLAQRQEVKGQ